MASYQIIPDKIIHRQGPISKAFTDKGINSFHDACGYILQLPYGRTSDKSDWTLVLIEGRGTCSTKHALIAALAAELELDAHLMLGIYPMKESNTPGVGKVLDNSEYDFLAEAHCYLEYKGERIDITGLSVNIKKISIRIILNSGQENPSLVKFGHSGRHVSRH